MDGLHRGRVIGAKPGQQIVVYAKNIVWCVQPFWSRPFTAIQSDSHCRGRHSQPAFKVRQAFQTFVEGDWQSARARTCSALVPNEGTANPGTLFFSNLTSYCTVSAIPNV